MTKYYMTTINSGTRVRADHNTFSAVVRSVAARVEVEGTEVWTAPADGAEVKAGDKWLKLADGWMALVHKGVPICNGFRTVEESEPVGKFPEWFDLTNPQGETKRYVIAG